MGLVFELEIETIVHFSNVKTLLSSVVLDDQLLEEEEGTLVVDSLSDLNLGNPQMRGVCLLAVIALLVGDNKLNDERLLQEGTIEHFLLDGELDLDSARMGLGPDETCINKLNALETLDKLEAEGEQLSRLEGSVGPWRTKVAVALTTVIDDQ